MSEKLIWWCDVEKDSRGDPHDPLGFISCRKDPRLYDPNEWDEDEARQHDGCGLRRLVSPSAFVAEDRGQAIERMVAHEAEAMRRAVGHDLADQGGHHHEAMRAFMDGLLAAAEGRG